MQRRLLIMPFVLALAACELGSTGEGGTFQFEAKTQDAGDSVLWDLHAIDRPVAVGAEIAIQVNMSGGGAQALQVEASVEPPGVFEILESGSLVRLRALSEGAAVLEVSSGGQTDRLTLQAREIASVELGLPHTLSLQSQLSHWSGGAGVAALAGHIIELEVALRDDAGTLLMGGGAVAAESTDPSVLGVKPVANSNRFRVTAIGLGEASVVAGESHFDLAVIAPSDVARLALGHAGADGPVEILEVPAGHLAVLQVLAFDTSDRAVLGVAGEPGAAFGAGAQGVLANADQPLQTAPDGLFIIQGECPGTTSLTISRFGLDKTVPVQVVDDVDEAGQVHNPASCQ